MAVEEDLK